MSEPSQEAKQAAHVLAGNIVHRHDKQWAEGIVQQAIDTATAKARLEIKAFKCVERAYGAAHQLLSKLGVGLEGDGVAQRIKAYSAKAREELEYWKGRANNLRFLLAHQQPKRFVCCYCGKNARELSSPHYLERVNRTGDTPAIWICTEHAAHQQPSAPMAEEKQ